LQIADAAENCKPRIYEESMRQFKELTNRGELMEQKFLRWIQIVKEDIILHHYVSGQPVHVLNRARNLVGREWGLDNDEVAAQDEHIEMGGRTTAEEFKATLKAHFTPALLIEEIIKRLLQDGNNTEVNQFLQGILPEEFSDFDSIFDGPRIKCKGVALILEKLGFLTR
jgi:hypothetical protein